jgi:phosphonate transport system substrate-binding protein
MKLLPALCLACCLALLGPSGHVAAACDDPRPLRLALVPMKNPEILARQYAPLIRQLEKELGRHVEVVPALSYGTVIEGLLAGGIDLAELGPASYAIAVERGAAITAFASFTQRPGPHTESASAYRSLLIVRRDRGWSSLEQLRGKTLSLTDPASTSGAVLPRQAVQQMTGSLPESYFHRVTFAGSHDRAIESVQKGLVDAAFVSSSRLDEALRRGTLGTDEIAVLWRSAPVPYDPIVLRRPLCAPLQAKIRQVFFGDSANLKNLFRELDINGFLPVNDGNYAEIRKLFATRP